MAFEVLKKSTLPASSFGRRASEPRVAIQGNGQIQFNTLASEALNGQTHVIVMFDGKSRSMKLIARDKGTKSLPLDEMIELRRGKGKDGKKGTGTPYFGGAAVCKHYGYDFNESGSQSFPCEVDAKAKNGPEVTFTLPEGALEPKPKRVRKTKGAATASATAPAEAKASAEAESDSNEPADDDLL